MNEKERFYIQKYFNSDFDKILNLKCSYHTCNNDINNDNNYDVRIQKIIKIDDLDLKI